VESIASLDIYGINAVLPPALPPSTALTPASDPSVQAMQAQQSQQQIIADATNAPEESAADREKRKGLPLCR
jgi:hypothetical protein